MSVLMIFASCSTDTSYDDNEIKEKTNPEVVEDEPKEDDTENDNKKLNFSSVSDSYIITDVMKKDSTINITIEWK